MGTDDRIGRSVGGAVAAVALFAAAVLVTTAGGSAQAASVTVTTLADSGPGSLRARISEANANANIDLILLPTAGKYQLTVCGTFENANATGDLDITRSQPLVIRGTAAGRAVIEQRCAWPEVDRVIDHRGSGALTLEHVAIQDGSLPDRPGTGGPSISEYHGGGIRSGSAALSILDSEISDHRAGDGGDAISAVNASPGGSGGAIYSTAGDLTITDSWIFGNRGGNGGDGSAAFGTNPASGGSGGAIESQAGDVTIVNSLIEDNAAGSGGDGKSSDSGSRGGVGGAIYADGPGSVSIVDSTIANNRGGRGGSSVAANGGDGGFAGAVNATSGVTVTIRRSTFDFNRGGAGGDGDGSGGDGGDGGAVVAPIVVASATTFSENLGGAGGAGTANIGGDGGDGGAVVAQHVTLTDVVLDSNEAGEGGSSLAIGGTGGSGGAVTAVLALAATRVAASHNRAGRGGIGGNGGTGGDGGVFATYGIVTPTMTIESSSFRINSAGTGGSPLSTGAHGLGGYGGAVHNFANAYQSTLITNSSFFENQAGGSGTAGRQGAGAALATNNLTMRYSTVVGNLFSPALRKARTGLASFDRITASVIGGNLAGNCDLVTQSGGYNVEAGGNSCSFNAATDRVNQSGYGLGPITVVDGLAIRLPTEGGLLDGAIPVAACSSGFLAGITTDQRGVSRPGGSGCEPGAGEIGSTPPLDPELDEAARFIPLAPVRLFDTRPGEPAPGPKGFVVADTEIDVQITGVGNVPPSAVAVVMNVTATATEGSSFVTVFPTGQSRPLASSINITQPGQTRPNLVTVPIGAGGKVTLYTQSGAHLLGDVAGYYEDIDSESRKGRFVPLTPQRLFDTRPGEPAPGHKGKLVAGQKIDVQVTGVGDVPAGGVDAIVLNLTGTEATALGYITAYPTGIVLPFVSNVNLDGPGATAPNLAIVPVGAGGKITIFSSDGAHVLGDVTGYITDSSTAKSTMGLFVPLSPERVFDTREGEPAPGPKGYVAAGLRIDAGVAGVAGLPNDAGGVVLNVTAIDGPPGFVTAWETGPAQPLASTINLAPPLDTRANGAMLPVGAGGKVSFFTENGSDLLADTFGYFLG